MIWQDIILTGGTAIFAVALIPSVLGENKPALTTSLVTGSVLVTFVMVYFSLALWFSAFMTTITASLWLTLAVQQLLIQRAK